MIGNAAAWAVLSLSWVWAQGIKSAEEEEGSPHVSPTPREACLCILAFLSRLHDSFSGQRPARYVWQERREKANKVAAARVGSGR